MTRHLAAACVLVASASCYDPDVKLGVPCSDQGDCPTGQSCDELSHICMLPTELRSWRDDTAADFEQPGAVLTDAIVEPAGFVGPAAYATGRVRLRAIASDTIGDLSTATWEAASAGTVTGTAFATHPTLDYGTDPPSGLGAPSGDNVTLLAELELDLDATGAWRFYLDANDKGFVDIAPPGGVFTRLVADANNGTTVTYDAATTGWYRVRLALADVASAMQLTFNIDSPAIQGGLRTIEVDRIRSRVDDLQGWLVEGFDDPFMLDYDGSTLLAQPLDVDIPADAFGLPIGMTGWGVRFSGQILIDTAGDYAFDVTSYHGHRLFIDGAKVIDAYADTGSVSNTSAPVTLERGWHDVVLDVTKEGTTTVGRARLGVASGPAFAGETIPLDHVRPLVPRSQRWTESHNTGSTAIPDASSASRTQSLTAPPGFTPDWIAVGYEIDHPLREQVSVVLQPPSGGAITMLSAGTASGPGTYGGQVFPSLASYGTSWQFTASDNLADAMTGNLTRTSVTITGSGGVAPFPTSSRYESAVHDLGNVVALGTLTFAARQGTVAKVELRTCADVASCATTPWIDVTSGDLSMIAPASFAQYAVSLTSDGDVPTALDWIELTYSAR